MKEMPLEMEYCQISTEVPLCSHKDFSSFPDLPYSCSPKCFTKSSCFTRPAKTLKQAGFM